MRGPLAAFTGAIVPRSACQATTLTVDPPWRREPYTTCHVVFGGDSTVSVTIDADSVLADLYVRILGVSTADSAEVVGRNQALLARTAGAGVGCSSALGSWRSDSVEAALWVRPEQDSRVPGTVVTYAVNRIARLGPLPDVLRCPKAVLISPAGSGRPR